MLRFGGRYPGARLTSETDDPMESQLEERVQLAFSLMLLTTEQEPHPPPVVDSGFDTRTDCLEEVNWMTRKDAINANTNAITNVDEGGAFMWTSGLSRLILSTSSEEPDILLDPEETIRASAFVGHDGFVFERSLMVVQPEFVDAITTGKQTPMGYASVTATRRIKWT